MSLSNQSVCARGVRMKTIYSLAAACMAIAALSGCTKEKTFTPSPETCTSEHINQFTTKEDLRDFLHAACSNVKPG